MNSETPSTKLRLLQAELSALPPVKVRDVKKELARKKAGRVLAAESFDEDVRASIHALLISGQFSQAELARHCDCSEMYIQDVRLGRRAVGTWLIKKMPEPFLVELVHRLLKIAPAKTKTGT